MLFSFYAFLAQAGGGGSFGSGGGGLGGGYSGGGGDGSSLFLYALGRLVFRYPLIGVPVAIVALFLSIKGSRRGASAHRGRMIRKTRSTRETPAAISHEALVDHDPGFDKELLFRRISTAFNKAQVAWCSQDLSGLRNFVSDGVFERFSLQVAEQVSAGWRQGMPDLKVGKLSMIALDLSGPFEAITVHIPFECTISKIDAKSGKTLPGSTLPERRFAECWTFLRRSGTKSLSAQGLIEGQCPNCGAPLEMARSALCSVCKSEVLSGQFDWILTEITQASIWKRTPTPSPEFAAYLKADPDLSVALFEDRASVAFWRLRLAEKRGEAGPLLGVSTANFTQSLQAKSFESRRLVRVECAVGSVEALGVIAGEEHDRSVVEVIWDSRRVFWDQLDENLPPGRRTLERDLLVFSRRSGQKTRWKTSFTAAHCQNCGGADTGDLNDLCPWCGEPRQGKRDNWLLEEVLPRSSSVARDLLATIDSNAAPKNRAPASRQLLTWAASLAASDGQMAPKEREALGRIALRTGMSAAEIDNLTQKELHLEEWQASAPPAGPIDQDEARTWLVDLVGLAHADGSIDRAEERWLLAAAERLGLTHADLRLAIKKEAGRLFQEAKAARKKAAKQRAL